MEHQGKTETELATALYGKPSSNKTREEPTNGSQTSQEQRREAVSLRLWVRLSEIFGAVFVTQYGNVDGSARQTWKQALEQYSEEQIARGVQHCLNWRKDFPPNLPQFLELCLTVPPKYHQPFKPDPKAPLLEHLKSHAKTPIARRAMAQMEAVMAGRTDYEFEGQTFPLDTPEQCYHKLGLGAWWGPL